MAQFIDRSLFSMEWKNRTSLLYCMFVILPLMAGCATQTTKKTYFTTKQDNEVKNLDLAGSTPTRTLTPKDPKDYVILGVRLENTNFDYPIVINSSVESWAQYFTGRGRKHFEKYLERSELFIPYIQPILKQHKLPEDLVYLAMIESGFHNHAYSRARAVGPWQFISATGKRYGLAVNWWVDERRDTLKSTIAAAGYLKDLFEMFDSWELASAAYNAGETRIAKAIKKLKTHDYWELTKNRRVLKPETRNYVPKIIAAALIAKNRTQFGFQASNLKPRPGEAIAPDGEVVKLETAQAQSSKEAEKEALESILRGDEYENSPELGKNDKEDAAAPADPITADLTPVDAKEEKDEAANVQKAVVIQTPHVNKKGELQGESLAEFEVQSPADLMKISRAAGLSYHTVKSLNPEILRWCTPPNIGNYRIKLPTSARDRFLGQYNDSKFDRKVHFASYRVKRGQSLKNVANHFGIRLDPLVDLNGISPKSMLKAGVLVRVPLPNDASRSVASLEIRDPPSKSRSKRRTKRRARNTSYREHKRVSLQDRAMARKSSVY